MGSKKSFVLYKNWGELFTNLPAEAAGELIQALCKYSFTEEELVIEDPVVNAMFAMIKTTLDEDADKYQAKVERMKSNAEKSRTDIAPKSTRNRNDIESDKEKDKDKDTEKEKDNKSPTETKKKSKKEKAAPTLSVEQMQDIVLQSELGCQVQDKVRDWIEYKHQRNEPYKDMGFKSLITQIGKHEREAGADAVCDLIDLCMSNEWKGIIWEKLQRSARADPGGKVDWDRV